MCISATCAYPRHVHIRDVSESKTHQLFILDCTAYKDFFPSLHSKVRSFPLPQHVTQSPIPTPSMITLHREWGFAVRLAIKYHSSLVCLFSPSGRDKQGKGIHYSCWLKSDFGPKAVHGWIVFGTHRLSTCFENDMLCNHRCWLIGLHFSFSVLHEFRIIVRFFSPGWR